ncbi:hypothetical protein [Legionella cincinnatiensis]|uniref:Uncharacterized protein n=1 Tax=Legionella cincinnatiensis TaxID=28085 RepID=A0A378IJM4_9GAMM|nr:hypothetical protein [Legionella cincinnatiensis]KTC78775.1 hypothetical protein Lcin_3390 [Legionella cincinnatiensis]STX35369.1 Uncharacterised protein [Legionella cincinnatiensis]
MRDTKKDVHLTTEVFKTQEDAEKAYQDAIDEGYTPKDINVMMSEDSRRRYYDSVLVKEGSKASQGLAIGGATGATVGGLVGAIAAVGTSLVIPGLGLVVAGPIAAGLAGAGAGGISGGLIGSLIGWGVPEDKAKVFESGIKEGGIVLSVNETHPNSHLSSTWSHYNHF